MTVPRAALRALAVTAVALVLTLAACAGNNNSSNSWPQTLVAATEPVGLHIPAIGVSTDNVMNLGVDDTGAVEVPPVAQPERLGWYAPGVAPGDPGPAVLLGHVNGGGRDGIFARLHELRPGDDIHVPTTTGTAVFVVDRVQTVAKDAFPTKAVYGNTERPELRLVTCGGTWDPVAHSYESQVIVYATEVNP